MRVVGVDVGPERVLITERFAAMRTGGFFLFGVADFEVLLKVCPVADAFMAHRAGTRFVWVVFCKTTNIS